LELLKLVRIVDERNYDYITRIRTGFWERVRKKQTDKQRNGRVNEWMYEWMNSGRKKETEKCNEWMNEWWDNGGNDEAGRNVK
jgi:hypothetical protein